MPSYLNEITFWFFAIFHDFFLRSPVDALICLLYIIELLPSILSMDRDVSQVRRQKKKLCKNNKRNDKKWHKGMRELGRYKGKAHIYIKAIWAVIFCSWIFLGELMPFSCLPGFNEKNKYHISTFPMIILLALHLCLPPPLLR